MAVGPFKQTIDWDPSMTFRSRLLPSLAILLTLILVPPALAAQFAVVETSDGAFIIELDDEKAPISVENFERYAKDGFYTNTVFHRVIPGFMIQGGGFDHHGNYPSGLHNKGSHQELRPPIANEWQNGLKNMRGTVAMARLGGQADSVRNKGSAITPVTDPNRKKKKKKKRKRSSSETKMLVIGVVALIGIVGLIVALVLFIV